MDSQTNEEIAERIKNVVLHALNWLDENEIKWELEEPMNKKEFIISVIERIAL